eukprot:TRINITY_DN12160_c0_g1_i1.p1 TRINITY_DN12160_c0_g1~~TRINITY_DN12160_c0_g1_i1.p1  ORF type:complete len:111 (-),score=12.34 TRINITY_DN12160_c0_g1_i1:167-499(-)
MLCQKSTVSFLFLSFLFFIWCSFPLRVLSASLKQVISIIVSKSPKGLVHGTYLTRQVTGASRAFGALFARHLRQSDWPKDDNILSSKKRTRERERAKKEKEEEEEKNVKW